MSWKGADIYFEKAVGRLRRRLVTLPERKLIKRGDVVYEFVRAPFLDEGDLKAMFTDSYDIELCSFLRKNLSAGDIFIDAGANVGYISAVAASRVGPMGEVHGFEPLPFCFDQLQRLKELNPRYHFSFSRCALGETVGTMTLAYNPIGEARNASLIPSDSQHERLNVDVIRLDDYLLSRIHDPARVRVIKIDVEGFEIPVILGLSRFLRETTFRPQIVAEVKPWVANKMETGLAALGQFMNDFGYRCYSLLRPRPLELTALRDLAIVRFAAA